MRSTVTATVARHHCDSETAIEYGLSAGDQSLGVLLLMALIFARAAASRPDFPPRDAMA
ncbi:hypothetical protein [Catenulispora acidiphila]|uniref:hypothetical protein n=1 Tax=Catenulispora acidiphila TaxID=304895 RepID=UPI00019E2EF4|nr:hypothetical protein [Catenulispora acidiphila]